MVKIRLIVALAILVVGIIGTVVSQRQTAVTDQDIELFETALETLRENGDTEGWMRMAEIMLFGLWKANIPLEQVLFDYESRIIELERRVLDQR